MKTAWIRSKTCKERWQEAKTSQGSWLKEVRRSWGGLKNEGIKYESLHKRWFRCW